MPERSFLLLKIFIKDFYLSFFIYLIYGIFSYRSQLRSQQVLPEKEVCTSIPVTDRRFWLQLC